MPATPDFTVFHNFVAGKPRGAKESYHGINPVTEEQLWDTPVAEEQDVEDAVAAATNAFPSWSRVPMSERRKKIGAWADRFSALRGLFKDLLKKECGKTVMSAEYEVELAMKNVVSYMRLSLPEETVELEDRTVYIRRVPLGVVAAICPWNVPIIVGLNKMIPALLTGNCVIMKPSPFSPYSIPKLVEIGQDLFPPGVLQVLGGNEKLGPWLVDHPKIQKISFTGSTPTGKAIMAAAAKTLKRVTVELGGNDPMIICPDVDIQSVAPQVVQGALRIAGQVCVGSKRIYVHQDIYDDFVNVMVRTARSFQPGPLQNKMQFEKVKGFLEDSKAHGHTFLLGGDLPPPGSKGYSITPAIIGNPPDDSRIVVEEQFGPIVPVLVWSDEAEVIARANDTDTGLGGCVWSADVERARRIGAELECGSVWINSFEKPTASVVMGGHKESGIGGEGGWQGLLAYCNTQVMHVHGENKTLKDGESQVEWVR